MPEGNITILSTRPLEPSLLEQAKAVKINIESIPFIRTEQIKDPVTNDRVKAIAEQPANVVFTSMNAADAVADLLGNQQPAWRIYCLGTATRKVIEKRLPTSSIIGDADNASALAEVIINNNEKQLSFFCGNQRRHELPDKLAGKQIELEELVVYKTIPLANKITTHYDAILFFSPSAVISFFSSNSLPSGTVLFSIGTTTSQSIKQFTNNRIIESDHPGKQHLVEKSLEYFGKLKRSNEQLTK